MKAELEKILPAGSKINDVPFIVATAVTPIPNFLHFKQGLTGTVHKIEYNVADKLKSMDLLNPKMKESLYDFQRAGIEYGIRNFGRILIADEMGVGKTIQALGLASLYQEAWPLIIVCPSSLVRNFM